MKPKVIIIGKLAPPLVGPALATEVILRSKLEEKFDLIHLDASDHRDINTIGAIDVQNIYLALKHYCMLIGLVLRYRPHLVYAPIGQTTISYIRDAGLVVIAKLFGRHVLCYLRGSDFRNWYERSHFLTKAFVRVIHSIIDGQIVLGEKLRCLFKGLIEREKIFVVPNGGDFGHAASREEKSRDKLTVLYLANFKAAKGTVETLKAVPEVFADHENIQFVFAGSWRDSKTKYDVESFLKLHPGTPVQVVGPVTGAKKDRLYQVADIFVFPPTGPEGHPWVIVEAMAAGLPIISTDQGAITESVIDGVNGFIVESKNPKAIAEKIKLLIENPELCRKMGAASRRLYLENFTEDKMVERLSNVFNTVLEGTKSAKVHAEDKAYTADVAVNSGRAS